MKFYSLNKQAPDADFHYATIYGQAPDKGLYFPEKIPRLAPDFLKNIAGKSKTEIGIEVMSPYTEGAIPKNILEEIITETVDFDFPLVKIEEKIKSLELFHGPTMAFKDVGARFMSRCLEYFNRNNTVKTTVLVATSGDTGGAVANGFLGVEGVEVVILYPKGKVSAIQELQLTTCGRNIKALEIDGLFDDCQTIVKRAFADAELTRRLTLTSANSINIARWLPQQLYYFFAWQQWIQENEEAPIVCVPSGNFGNICAGILANASGLPVKHFLAATNANDEIPKYFQTGKYTPQKAVATVSNAMDVGDPSNFVRILEIFRHDFPVLKDKVSSVSVSEEDTKAAIKEVYSRTRYILDPHGAVAYKALSDFLEGCNDKGFILETAHPVKFPEIVEAMTGSKIAIPEKAQYLLGKKKEATELPADFQTVKDWLLQTL